MPPTIDAELRALAAAIREIRARQQLSQERVAGRSAASGASTSARSSAARSCPSFAALVGIARGLDVPLSELVRVYEERLRASVGAERSADG